MRETSSTLCYPPNFSRRREFVNLTRLASRTVIIEPMEPTKVDLSLLVPRFPAIFPNLTNPVFKFNTLICKEALISLVIRNYLRPFNSAIQSRFTEMGIVAAWRGKGVISFVKQLKNQVIFLSFYYDLHLVCFRKTSALNQY